MVRKSKREIERALDEIDGKEYDDVTQPVTMAELHDIVERVNDRVVRLDTGELRICPIPSADDIREALGGEV
mgnify:CR=1 FL=1